MQQTDEPLAFPGWVTLKQAADRLGVTRQAAGQIAVRCNWRRGKLDSLILLRELDVEMHALARSGPRRPSAAE